MTKRRTLNEFLDLAREKHHNRYIYDLVGENVSNKSKITIICPEHGEFKQMVEKHLSGQGCPLCGGTQKNSLKKFILKANEIHNNKYDYSKVEYVNNKSKVCIICPEHGEFWQDPHNHLKGKGCPICGGRIKNNLTFIESANIIHSNKYDYSKVDYRKNNEKVCIICPEHGEFWQTPANHLQGEGCPKCSNGMHCSKMENELFEFLTNELNLKVERSNRGVLDDNLEIDIYLPEYKVGIECNGVYWHSEKFKKNNYHLSKSREAEKKGVRLLHFFEDEWVLKKEIVKSMIKSILGLTSQKIYARKCVVRNVPFKEKMDFLNKSHIQGHCQSSTNLGLYYNDELVSLMTFGEPRINMGGKKETGVYELARFCNKLNCSVIGGASKLLDFFIKNYKPKEIITYADKRWSIGNLYRKLEFEHIRDSSPNYFYVNKNVRENRYKYRKSILVKEGFDKEKSEHEIMLERNIYRIYDCGTMVFSMKL